MERKIAKECNISTRTVQRALNDLEEASFFERESPFHERRGQKSNLFHINENIVVQNETEEIDLESIIKNDKRELANIVICKQLEEVEQEVFKYKKVESASKQSKKGLFLFIAWGL